MDIIKFLSLMARAKRLISRQTCNIEDQKIMSIKVFIYLLLYSDLDSLAPHYLLHFSKEFRLTTSHNFFANVFILLHLAVILHS